MVVGGIVVLVVVLVVVDVLVDVEVVEVLVDTAPSPDEPGEQDASAMAPTARNHRLHRCMGSNHRGSAVTHAQMPRR